MKKAQTLRGGWRVRVYALALASLLCTASAIHASQLTLPTVGPSDAALAGNTVAFPLNATNALFHNPAQLSLMPNQVTGGLLAIRFLPSYENNQGYDSTSRELPLAPNIGYATDRFAPYQFGMGVYGSLGFSFNHDADPERGVPNNFFAELVSISLAPAVSYSLAPNLHLGAAINPTYGRLRLKSPSPAGRIDLDVRGPGIFGTLGVLYQPTPKLNLALSYKTRGKIWMFGNARVNGGGDDATVYFNIPQNVKFGFSYELTERFTLMGQAQWTQLSVFQDSRIRFDERTFLNQTIVRAAKDRWRLGAGVQYEVFDGVKLRAGFSYEPWAIEDNSLAPTLSDTTDFLFPFGLSIERGQWIVDVTGGLTHTEKRRASTSENPFFPGRYKLDETVFGFQITRLLGPSGSEVVGSEPVPAVQVASARNYSDFVRYSVARSQRDKESESSVLTDPRQGEALLDSLIVRLSPDAERATFAPADNGEALLDSLIVKFSRNRCTIAPRSEIGRRFALSDAERKQWCKRWDSLRPA